ncbi:LysR family transcriptional regulator [Marinobacterium sedimentorum]|uniref:LysR family transcriptional regulator n=1 Tax=Marinobacterium sedimentorum TaxID=2927804 RepID=UPI0020C5B926|nr:LysR substrate-binding domain-containing protein [Marinobacterium sedimentorum]MCP8690035.1 LysR substrate-binding domain-containing protein [Marinobacterium sedimentorum]
MNTKQLTAFRAIMQQGSMSDAARRLDVSQPAISRLIRDLEQDLGFSLFERRNSRVYATAAARAFYRQVQHHFSGLDRLEQSADQIRMMKSGSLRIGAIPALAQTVLPAIIAGFRRGRDDVAISLGSYETDELLPRVAGHQFDLALVELPADTAGVQSGPAYSADQVCIAPAGHHFGASARVRVEDLEHEPFISVGCSDSAWYQRAQRLLRDCLVRPDEVLAVERPILAPALVREGVGVALVDPFSALLLPQDTGLVRPFEPALSYCIGFVQPLGREQTQLERAFIDSFEAGVGRAVTLQPIEPDEASAV